MLFPLISKLSESPQLMSISLATMASKPGMWSNPYTAAAAGGAAIGSLALSEIGKGRKAATKFVSGFEDPFGQQLAQISTLADTDPKSAAQQLRSAWNKFYSDAQRYIAKGGNDAKVARQALTNMDLMTTVDRLSAQLGIPSVRSGAAASSFTGSPQGISLSTIGKSAAVAALPGVAGAILNRGDVTGGRGTASPAFPAGPGEINLPGMPFPTPEPPVSPPAMKPPGQWDWLLDAIIPAGVTGGLNLLGGYLGSRASKDAAKILADAGIDAAKLIQDAADKVLAQQKGIYEQSRQDMMPWLNTGRAALGELSNRMGLRPEGMPGPQLGTSLSAMGGGGGMPDFEAEAERYRQGRRVG